MKKKALIVGEFNLNDRQPDLFVRNAFEKALDWKVVPFSYREMAAETSARNMMAVLDFTARKENPDLMLIMGGDFLDPRGIGEIRNRGVKVIMWHLGFPKGGLMWRQWTQHGEAKPEPWQVALGRECDVAFFAAAGCESYRAEMLRQGVNCFYLLGACDPQAHGKDIPQAGVKDKGLIYTGQLPGRDWYVRRVVDALGAKHHHVANMEQWSRLIVLAKINLHCQFNNDSPGYIEPDLFASIASGTMTLAHRVPNIDLGLKPGEHFVVFNDIEDGQKKAFQYLTDDAERERIAAAGRKHVLKNHTYKSRLKAIVGALGLPKPDRPAEIRTGEDAFRICLISPNSHHQAIGPALAEKHGVEIVWDVPTPDTDVMVVAHHDFILPAVIFKSLYPDIPLAVLVWDVKPWLKVRNGYDNYVNLMKAVCGMADLVLAPTRTTADAARDLFGVEPKVMPFWYNPARRRRADDTDQTVVCVGRFEPHKNQAALIRAVAAMNGDRPPLKLIGWNGPTVGFLKDLARHLGVEVEFMVDAAEDEKWDALSRAALFVNPSEYEGDGGMATMEAVSMNIPVIAAESESVQEIFGTKIWSFVPGSVSDLARALESARKTGGGMPLMSARGRGLKSAAGRLHRELIEVAS